MKDENNQNEVTAIENTETRSSNLSVYEKEFDFVYELEITDDIPIVVNQGGKRTILLLQLNIDAKIKAYLEELGVLERLEELEERVDDLEDTIEDLEDIIDELEDIIDELESNGGGSGGGSTDDDGNPRTSQITVYGYEGMTVVWTNPKGASESFVLASTAKVVLTVTDLGTYEFKGTYATESKTVSLGVNYYDQEYEVEIYIYDKIKLADCSWATIKGYADDGTAKYRFDVGDTKDITTADGTRTIEIKSFPGSTSTTFTYVNGIGCAILFETTFAGYKTHIRTFVTPNSDEYNETIKAFYDGFNEDLKAVIPLIDIKVTYSTTLSQRVFTVYTERPGNDSTYYGKKRSNNGNGVVVPFWAGNGMYESYEYRYYCVGSSGYASYMVGTSTACNTELHDVFRFCL